MFINSAHAQEAAGAATATGAADPTLFNLGMIFVLFILFYFLLIRPQNKRMKEQKMMLDSLVKGDKVVTAGGLVGKITKIVSDSEVEIELAQGIKVIALRYTIQQKADDTPAAAANDSKAKVEEKPATASKKTTKKPAAKKTTAKKTTASKATKKAAPKTAEKK